MQSISNSEELSKVDSTIEQLKSRINTRINNKSNAYLIVSTVDDLLNCLDERQSILSKGSKDNKYEYTAEVAGKTGKYTLSDDAVSEDEESLNLIFNTLGESEEMKSIYSLDYDIGGIGDTAFSVVENYFKLVTPYGFTKYALEDKYTNSKLLGIELYAMPGDNIRSQWNGVVVGVYDDLHGQGQVINVYHGNSTYTKYSHVLAKGNITVGAKVKAGGIIAVAADTSSSEPGKDNHILYQIKLNGEFINPLLIYGTRGQKIYEDWLTSYPYDNVVELGEEYFNSGDNAIVSEKEDDVLDVLYPDFNLDN